VDIGVIGSGRIGSVVGRLWAQAGHRVMFSSRHPEDLDELVRSVGGDARRGSIEDAACFAEVALLSVPLNALPELGQRLAPILTGKVVLESANPNPGRDGQLAQDVIGAGGAGPVIAGWLPGVRLVRAFNSVWDQTLAQEAHRPPPQVGIPLASDDDEGMNVAATLVRDAGFEPVKVGALSESRRFDVGTPVYNTGMSGPELRTALGLTN
jgi:8-hydroxy-5-deazaflavin:NADPH oxidoreductase